MSNDLTSKMTGPSTSSATGARRVGVLMLKTRFPRFPGDIGNPQSFTVDSLHKVVDSASSAAIVTAEGIDPQVADDLVQAAIALGHEPVDLILTSCGFLSELQQTIQQQVSVPVLCSSLVLLPLLRSLFGDTARIGIMTFDSAKLSKQHLGDNTGDYAIVGMQDSPAFFNMISKDLSTGDFKQLEAEVCQVAAQLKALSPRAVVLECTNLSPYKSALREMLDVPVYDIMDAAEWLLAC